MSLVFRTIACTVLCCVGLAGIVRQEITAHADEAKIDSVKTTEIKPEVMALLKQSTDAYKKMKSYEADVVMKTEAGNPNNETVPVSDDEHFVLALERPNRFCYKAIAAGNGTAAVSNGKTFINFKSNRNQFMKTPAPAEYKGINIVDDVEFAPLGTYFIALMLQGDALADKDVKDSLQKASLGPVVTENGKKWQVLHILFGPREDKYDLYFGADDHLLGKTVLKFILPNLPNRVEATQTELLQNVRIDKQVDPSAFEYTPPDRAHQVEKFTAPQRPGDARNERSFPTRSAVRLAAYAPPNAPGISPQVFQLLKQASDAYEKMNSYRHTSVCTVSGTLNGKPAQQSAKFSLEMQRLNKLAFRRIDNPNVAVVCDGKSFYDFRINKYTQIGAPSTLKELTLHIDDFDPVAATYLVAQLFLGDALTDNELQPILLKAKAHLGITENDRKWDTLEMTFGDLPFTIYFDANSHQIVKAMTKVPNQNTRITETLGDIAIDTSIPDADFNFIPPPNAKKVNKLVESDIEAKDQIEAANQKKQDDIQAKQKAIEAADKEIIARYEGKPAPNFVAKTPNGKELSLSDFKGKIVLLEFWSSYWKPCKMVMTSLQNLQNRYANQDVIALGVDTWDTTDDCIQYLRDNPNFTLPILLDPAGSKADSIAAKLYSVSGTPTTLIIDKNGIVQKYILGVKPFDYYVDVLNSMGVK